MKLMKESEVQPLIKEGWIRVKGVFEIAGFPEEHINKTIKLLAEKLQKEKIKVIEQKIHAAKTVSDKMFASFIEMEFLVTSLSQILGIIYDYLPSSIEIIEPHDPISDDPLAMTELMNDLIARLHKYSQTIQGLSAQNNILKQQLKQKK
jgi:hypothetical protein